MEYKVTITMPEDGSMTVNGNVSGPHLIGVLEMAKNAVMKDIMGPIRDLTPEVKETPGAETEEKTA